tara:strand:- start:179 stop:442 length:264 start_codon:yes stop_codon:yes gene_type:complete
MIKLINIFFILITLLFLTLVFKHYLSNKNIKKININRSNIENIVKSKISNLPKLKNDTKNVIEFNSGYQEEIKQNKPRNFWQLLKVE